MRNALFVTLMIAVFGTSGCYRASVVHKNVKPGQKYEKTQPYLIYGLVPLGDQTMTVGSNCPRGLYSVEAEHTFIDGLLIWITVGIYAPITVRYTCAK